MRNVYACLVHEHPDLVVDLVRNLRHLDPGSEILLYNGGDDRELIAPAIRIGGSRVLAHPNPQRMRWGRLHDFAFDCMRYALAETDFDVMTIVDSDQLATRPGYSEFIGRYLAERPRVGMLGSSGSPEAPRRPRGPALAAAREIELWRPFLRRFERGEEKFPYWTFWPATAFTRAAANDLVAFVDADDELARILEQTSIWATEEVVLPTLVALLGHEVHVNPCSDAFVKYRVPYTIGQVESALRRPDVFWIHPVPRKRDDPLRRFVRDRHGNYAPAVTGAVHDTQPPLLLRGPIIDAMRQVQGWLSEAEADLLIAAVVRALTALDPPHAIVEVGSFCGRGTVVLSRAAHALDAAAKVYAIDPHDGRVGTAGGDPRGVVRTRERLAENLERAGVADRVVTIASNAAEVEWRAPISLLIVDHLHDYLSVSRDFRHFEPWLAEGALIAFHDYADYFPDVRAFVHELLAGGGYRAAGHVDALFVLEATGARAGESPAPEAVPGLPDAIRTTPRCEQPGRRARRRFRPLVSCLMPTYDRREFVPQAIEYFLRQDLADVELIVIDDGPEPIDDLMPDDTRVRLLRLEQRATIGAKRNQGAEIARGELLANWDDDDWYAPWRLSYQAEEMSTSGADVCGLASLLYINRVDGSAWRYLPPPALRPWLADPTLMFTRALWRRNPFPDTSMGIDCRFLWHGPPKRLRPLERDDFFVGLIHSANTSPKDTGHHVWHPVSRATIDPIIGRDLERRPAANAGRG